MTNSLSAAWRITGVVGRCVLLAGLLALPSCGGDEAPAVSRLVDAFAAAEVLGTPQPEPPPNRTEWRFDDPEHGWQAGGGVADLRTSQGLWTGRSATSVPIVHVERSVDAQDADVLDSIVVRARISAGNELSVSFSGRAELNLEQTIERIEDFPWQLATPIVVGEEVQNYTIRTAATARTSYPAASIRHILLRPTDTADAEFAIESVRLVWRQEQLASIASGVSWQGLSEVYRETIVTRAPEEVRFDVVLPSDPMLDLAIGTVEQGPLTFRVLAEQASGERKLLLERTVTTAQRWQETPLDLADLAGRRVTLSLQLEATNPGAIGFWGAPVVRSRDAGPGGESAPKHVVFILVDTLRSDHLDAYGYERTTAPTVSRLASEGTLFRDAIAQGAWTKVSVPSMLSSTYPTSNGIHELFHRLPASADTLAEAFVGAGYATWGGSANGFSGRANNLHQGLEVFHERGSLDLPEGQSRSKTARLLTDRLLPWLDAHSEVPFFVFYHPIDPHSPYEPYPPYDTLWARSDGKQMHQEWVEKVKALVDERRRNGNLPHREDLEEVGIDPDAFNQLTLDWYDGSIRAADIEIQRLLEKLEELEILDETLIVFVSDHGEEFLEHGGGFHEDNVYGELVNVPFVLRWPGVVPAGRVIDQTVEMMDLAPTLLELAGIEVPGRMHGESLVPLFASSAGDTQWGSRPAISEWKRRTDQKDRGGVDAFSFILDGYKLVHNVERPAGAPEFELYDHSSDPLDQTDISSQHPEIVARLARQLQSWHEWALANALPTDAQAAEGLDAEELSRLRSLGYL